ncbi:hypothetical protein BC830DRAFT_1149981 [Chytriomyces sp. MP71]|nr:hypothetical protein BC830DRAFT_1149981 [Chytriomyces sp. MP71]
MPSAAIVQTIRDLNFAMGMVSFSSILFMLHSDSWDVDWSPRSLPRIMMYLDALAFFIFYLGHTVADVSTCEFGTGIIVVAEAVWSFKDSCKFAYIVHRGLIILGSKRRYPTYYAALGSLGLYWWYVAEKYYRSGTCISPNPPEPFLSLVFLYSFWSFIEIGVSALIVRKMMRTWILVQRANFAMEKYGRFKRQEESTLLFACVGMLAVTGLTVVHFVSQIPNANGVRRPFPVEITKIVFVFMQLWILMGSASGQWTRESNSDEDASDTESERGSLMD